MRGLNGEALALATSAGTLPPVVAQAVAAIALGLLGASGIMKLIDPEPTTGAMDVARLPSSNLLSRILGLAEIAIAIAGLSVAGASNLAAALLYAAFALFTLVALVTGMPLQSCGCFGRQDTPPTPIHLTLNLVATTALLVVYFQGAGAIDWGLAPLKLILYLGFTTMGVYASYLLMTRLPQVLVLARKA